MKQQKSLNKTSDNIEFTTDGRTSNKVKDMLADRVQKRAERAKKATAIIDDLRSSNKQIKARQLKHKGIFTTWYANHSLNHSKPC